MTVTTSNIQTISVALKTELEAGTYTNYGTTPHIYRDDEAIGAANDYITLGRDVENILYTVNNSPICFNRKCELKIFTRNRTDMDNLYADIINVIEASSLNMMVTNIKDLPVKGRYLKSMEIKLLK